MFSTHALSNSGTPRARIQTRRKQRGQSMVEFALVLPILLLLTLIALDFGRVYLGWINLQNMTRIAANFAANNPTAWTGTGDATIQLQYKNQVLADASASNCVLPTDDVSGVTKVPPPTFTYANGHGTPGLGDTAQVGISCRFGVITPVISNILGGQVNVSSSSVFPVKSGMTGTGGAGGGGSKPNAAFTGNGMTNTTTVNGTTTTTTVSGPSPFVVQFRDTSGGSPTIWSWNFGGGVLASDGTSLTSTAQDPLDVTFTGPATYTVSMTATNALGSSGPVTQTVVVTAAIAVNFTSIPGPADITAGQSVDFTSTATPGGTAYDWNFGDGSAHGTTATVTHTYSTSTGSPFTVTLIVTYPTGPVSLTKVAYVTFKVGLCTVPSLNGVKRNSAQGIWNGAPYNLTGTVSDGPVPPNGNYTITSQSLTALSSVPCDSNIVVNNP
jgi:Flp pilus assembly protein TadG